MALHGHFRWPSLGRIVSSRYWLELECWPETMQRIRVSWTGVTWAAGAPGCTARIAKHGWQCC